MNKELKQINERIVFWSNTKPKNMTREEHRVLIDQLFSEKRMLLAGEPTQDITRLR